MILITGGAGYIGSHINKLLNKSGYDTIVLDNLIKGHEEAVKWGKFVNVDLGDESELKSVFETYDIEAVMHFAAFSSVAESVQEPEKYFKNNYENTRNLLKVMNEFGVKRIIFSSTAALYGIPETVPIKEDAPLQPINPYGFLKILQCSRSGYRL